MDSQNILFAMFSSPRTVFTLPTLMTLTGVYDRIALSKSLYYYKKKGLVLSPRAGVYVKPGYDEKEFACALFDPSYISLQYVLARSGVVFQYSDRVDVICSYSRTLLVDGKEYCFRRINPFLWSDDTGILQKEGYRIATPERALLDVMYLYPGIGYFDRTDGLNFNLIAEISRSYRNVSFEKRVDKWIRTNISSL